MPTPDNKDQIRPGLSRRGFLAGATAAAAGMAVGGPDWALANPPATQPATAPAAPPEPWVTQARCENVIEGRIIQTAILQEMIEWCLITLTRTSTAQEAWQRILRPDDVVGLKFNRSGAEGLGTTPDFARVLIRSIVEAGWRPEQLVPIEVPTTIYAETGTTKPSTDWDDDEVDFGSGRDRLASVLRQVTALVNIPFLKTHNIAGITGCLKNLSHALVKHPARFHDNGCSPYIGDIVALPQIRNKLRVHIVNALRSVFDGGPEAHDSLTWQSGIVWAGFDPVALDTVGLDLINQHRKRKRQLPYVDADRRRVDYLHKAAARGLGCGTMYEIKLAKRLF